MSATTQGISSAERSPHASSRYRELVESANREPVKVERDFDFTDATSTWDQLTACEAEVFGIDPRLLNALLFAYMRYEDLIGVTDAEFYPYRSEERVAFPEWFKGEGQYSMDDAITFMTLVCSLPMTQAISWVSRARIQQIRSGLVDDFSEPSDWMSARTTGK